MKRTQAMKLLNEFINQYTIGDGENRDLLHEALSCLEDELIRYDSSQVKEGKFISVDYLNKVITSHSRKGVRHYEDSWDIRPSMLIEELNSMK